MSWLRRHKEPERYYLFPGQGGRAVRKKHKMMLIWGLAVGLLVSGILGSAIYLYNSGGYSLR